MPIHITHATHTIVANLPDFHSALLNTDNRHTAANPAAMIRDEMRPAANLGAGHGHAGLENGADVGGDVLDVADDHVAGDFFVVGVDARLVDFVDEAGQGAGDAAVGGFGEDAEGFEVAALAAETVGAGVEGGFRGCWG